MIKRLSACIREYKKPTILTPVCMVGEVVCECTIPLITADLINSIQNGCQMSTILSYGIRLFIIAMLSLGFGLMGAGFDVFNIANNHMLDKGAKGYINTIEYFNTLPVTMIGGYTKSDYDNIRTL